LTSGLGPGMVDSDPLLVEVGADLDGPRVEADRDPDAFHGGSISLTV
jgi:hypothetical protein